MSSVLCLWKYPNYLIDKSQGLLTGNPAFNSHQSRLHSATQLGEKAFLVTYLDGRCYLVGRIVVKEKYFNEPDYEYGEFGIQGETPESSYYQFGSIDITDILRKLYFKSGKRIDKSKRPLSLHLQTIREVTDDDVALLDSCIP